MMTGTSGSMAQSNVSLLPSIFSKPLYFSSKPGNQFMLYLIFRAVVDSQIIDISFRRDSITVVGYEAFGCLLLQYALGTTFRSGFKLLYLVHCLLEHA